MHKDGLKLQLTVLDVANVCSYQDLNRMSSFALEQQQMHQQIIEHDSDVKRITSNIEEVTGLSYDKLTKWGSN